ncbi:amino acid deaminase [Renibacterium salmoninarum]|nr:amino acid deaminase [Renibacterium salmoninarum]
MNFPANDAIERLSERVLEWRFKASPVAAEGQQIRQFLARSPRLAEFSTPLLTLDGAALDANLERMAQWCQEHSVALAPHGKTTMAPQLWKRQLDRGAWGMSLANLAQLRVAKEFGFRQLMLANVLADPEAIRWVANEVSDGTRILSWVDSIQTVRRIDSVLSGTETLLEVLVELGAPGGRTGARGIESTFEMAQAVQNSRHLRLVGVAGYEGSLAHDASASGLRVVRAYLADLKILHERLLAAKLYAPDTRVILSAGGSAYFDLVVEVLGNKQLAEVELILRSGAYLVHDDGFYRAISPFSRAADGQALLAGMHGWARVASQPEPRLAILDAGKRDLPFDEGLPQPLGIAEELGQEVRPLVAASISAVNDQHSYLRYNPELAEIRIGQVIKLGLSHPCTAFDKWTLIPVLDEGIVVDLVHTFF